MNLQLCSIVFVTSQWALLHIVEAAISSATCAALDGTIITNGNCIWLEGTGGAGKPGFDRCNTVAAAHGLMGKTFFIDITTRKSIV